MDELAIEDATLIAEVKELADLIGISMIDALRRAIHETLARERVARDEEYRRRYEAIMAIAERASKLFPPGTTSDHSDLYDENGLPT